VSSDPPSSRHRAREVALQTLYAIDLDGTRCQRRARERGDAEQPSDSADSSDRADSSEASGKSGDRKSPEAIFSEVAAHFEAPLGARAFAWALISEVCARGSSIDALIAARARNWRLSRMAAVDRNILRLGTYELAHTDTPAAVVMNEAVELARRFGSDASPAFVNGILDALAHELREAEL
jgi:N utilization substance protein B